MPGAYLLSPVLRQAHVRRSAICAGIQKIFATEKNRNKLTTKYASVKAEERKTVEVLDKTETGWGIAV